MASCGESSSYTHHTKYFLLVCIIKLSFKIDELQQIDLEVGQSIDIYYTGNITLICDNIDPNMFSIAL